MADQCIALPLKRFLIVAECPADWRGLDLYLFRDDEVVFYAGQSYLAYDRVWQHITDGYKARSLVGRFVLCNWPSSMRFTIELWNSQADRFAEVDHDLNAAERLLIEQYAPCFNEALNRGLRPCPIGMRRPARRSAVHAVRTNLYTKPGAPC